MPLINVEFDDKIVTSAEALSLSEAVRDFVSSVTGIEDVFVYANSAQIKVQVAPIEIFVRMSSKIHQEHPNSLDVVKEKLLAWKTQTNFKHPINVTVIPMEWQIAIGI